MCRFLLKQSSYKAKQPDWNSLIRFSSFFAFYKLKQNMHHIIYNQINKSTNHVLLIVIVLSCELNTCIALLLPIVSRIISVNIKNELLYKQHQKRASRVYDVGRQSTYRGNKGKNVLCIWYFRFVGCMTKKKSLWQAIKLLY